MPETFQDDSRETETRELFNLEEVPGRSETDAVLTMQTGQVVEFELKSTSDKNLSVTTVRDFGLDHILKWKNKHWLIAFYNKGAISPSYYLYGSPKMMDGWIQEKYKYIISDFKSAEIIPERVLIEDMYSILGEKLKYSYEDARSLHKRQYSKKEYIKRMDISNGYSKEVMLDIYRDRINYLIKRGSTLNNPHIPGSYFKNWSTKIDSDHAKKLNRFVQQALEGFI